MYFDWVRGENENERKKENDYKCEGKKTLKMVKISFMFLWEKFKYLKGYV